MKEFISSADNSLPIIDFEHLTMLEELSDDQESLVFDLTEIFKNTTPSILEQLMKAITQDDRNLIRQIAHRLKGSAANIGARRMAEECRQLEIKACSEHSNLSASCCTLIEQHFLSSERELSRWLSKTTI